MKNALLLFLVFGSSIIFAQIPNNSFETWSQGDPTGWFTSDIFGFYDAVTQSTTSYNGSYAAKMSVIDNGFGQGYPPLLYSGDIAGTYFPINQRYGSMTGYFQYFPQGTDEFVVTVGVKAGNDEIGGGAFASSTQTSSYNQFTVPIIYIDPRTPDSAFVAIYIGPTGGGLPTIGSYALVDYLNFGGTVGVEPLDLTATDYSLRQNYPNPFNPQTNIEYSIPERALVDLTVYNLLGEKVAVLVNEEQPQGTYRATFDGKNLPSGLYITRLQANNFVRTIKMTLIK